MKSDRPNLDSNLDRLLGLFNAPSDERLAESRNNIQQRLPDEVDAPSSLVIRKPRVSPRFRIVVLGVASAVAAALVATVWIARPIPAAVAETSLYRLHDGLAEQLNTSASISLGDVVRAGDGSSAIKLTDGSRVELRSKTEFYLERAEDGLRIHLNNGSVIVTAAKQHAGHLYVQTKDVIVSVVGTVFLVNAEEEGSRVAVIEGEVRVQQGTDTKTLFPGEQLSTNPKLDSLPVKKELEWSPNAPSHVALLQQSIAPSPVRPAPPRLEFASVSVRLPGPLAGPTGFACRGVEGIRRTVAGEQGDPGSQAPQGRCVGYASLGRLVEFAFNMPHRMGPQTPDWSRSFENAVGERPRNFVTYQIEAVAENPSTVTVEQLRQMVRTMLENRFKLESHVEMQEVPIYAMVIAAGGIKIRETKDTSGDEYVMAPDFTKMGSSSTGGPILQGKSRLSRLATFVTGFVNPLGFVTGGLASHVEDRTGLPGIYEYELALPLPGGGARGIDGGVVRPSTANAPDQPTRAFGWRAPAMSDELEHQLGLKLQLQKVRAEVLIVDKVERPSEN